MRVADQSSTENILQARDWGINIYCCLVYPVLSESLPNFVFYPSQSIESRNFSTLDITNARTPYYSKPTFRGPIPPRPE